MPRYTITLRIELDDDEQARAFYRDHTLNRAAGRPYEAELLAERAPAWRLVEVLERARHDYQS